MTCVDAATLARFSTGELAEAELERLEAHLGACDTCCKAVAALGPSSPPVYSKGDQTQAMLQPVIRRGTALGRYVICEMMGAGGMGVVYSAFDPHLERKVALKLLRAPAPGDGAASQLRERLLLEAQAMAKLAHPNVISVFDVGTFGDQVFIAMELIDGQSLREWLHGPRRPWREVQEVFVQAARGLCHAHTAGIVHRDFKPDNVLIGVDGRVRVTDFGLARSSIEPQPPSLAHPEAHVLEGTPSYMAPEQLLKSGQSDARADQFSFCVALWEAWYGQRPFIGANLKELEAEVLAGRVVAPPSRPRIPARLRRALLKGLSAKPEERFPSMQALLGELEADRSSRGRWVAPVGLLLSVGLGLLGMQEMSRRQLRQCEGAPARLAAVLSEAKRSQVEKAFAASGKLYAADTFHTVDRLLKSWGEQWAAMGAEACLATRVRREQSEAMLDLRMACLDRRLRSLEALLELMSQPDAEILEGSIRAAQSLPTLQACADLDALLTTQRPPQDEQARASLTQLQLATAQAQALFSAGKYERAAAAAEALLPAARATGYRPPEAELLFLQGRAQAEGGSYPAAASTLLDAALAAEAGHHQELTARAWLELARVVGGLQLRVDQGAVFARHAAASIEQSGQSSELTGRLEDVRGQLAYYGEGKIDESLGHERKALALLQAAVGPEDPQVLWIRGFIGWMLKDQGHFEEAISVQQEVLTVRTRLFGLQHPETAKSLHNLASMMLAGGKAQRAVELERQALSIWTRELGPAHPLTARGLAVLAEALFQAGRPDEALAELERALPLFDEASGVQNPRLAMALGVMGEVLLKLDQPDRALESFQRSVQILEKASGPEHPWLGPPLTGVSKVWLKRGSPAQAVESAGRAVALLERTPDNLKELADARFVLARALHASGGDKQRSVELALAARAWFVRAPSARLDLAEVDAWLSKRNP